MAHLSPRRVLLLMTATALVLPVVVALVNQQKSGDDQLAVIRQDQNEEYTSNKNAEHVLKILLCSSGRLNGYFTQVVGLLNDEFPELRDGRITGDNYPTPPIVEFLTNVLSLFQFIGITWVIVGGEKLLRMLPFYKTSPLPSFYWTIQDNPIPLAIFLFLIAPPMIAKLQVKGAFEIYLDDDVLIFSALKSGAPPTRDVLIERLLAAGLKQLVRSG